MALPIGHVQLILDASTWIGIPESERTSVQRAITERQKTIEAAGNGAPFSAVAIKDDALRAAVEVLYARVMAECRIPPRDDALAGFIVGLLCSGADASTQERSIASRTAAEAIEDIRVNKADSKYIVRTAISVLCGLRRVLLEDTGILTYRNTLSLHRAAKAIFSTPHYAHNARRARLVTLAARGTMEFEGLWELTQAYENSILQR